MVSTTETDISPRGVANLLTDRPLNVPLYQRSYAWEDGHVKAFLQDISNAIDSGEKEYFIGSIVSTRNEGGLEMVLTS